MRRCVLVSGGQDSRILHHMLRLEYPNIISVNIRKPKNMDVFENADVIIKHIKKGDSTYTGTLYTVEKKLIPFYDEIWVASNKIPNEEWFINHEECPVRGELIPKYPNKFKTPYQDLFKWEVLQIALNNNINLTGTHSCTRQVKSKGHCRKCWFCKEREWAYNKLGIEVYWE